MYSLSLIYIQSSDSTDHTREWEHLITYTNYRIIVIKEYITPRNIPRHILTYLKKDKVSKKRVPFSSFSAHSLLISSLLPFSLLLLFFFFSTNLISISP